MSKKEEQGTILDIKNSSNKCSGCTYLEYTCAYTHMHSIGIKYICVMSPYEFIMAVLILGVNTLYRLFCFFKLFLMVGKGLIS